MDQSAGIPFQLQHPDGSVLRGLHTPPLTIPGKAPAVIYSHGFNGCIARTTGRIEAFAAAGIHFWMFDFRGGSVYSTSDGVMREMMTIQSELDDLRLVIDHVRSLPEVDPDRIYLMGESQGGFLSSLMGSAYPGIAGLILWFPALVIPEESRHRMATGQHQVFGLPLNPDYDRLSMDIDPWAAMPGFTGPVLVLHGDKDPVVPTAYSRKAAELYPNGRFHLYPEAVHGFGGDDFADAIARSIALVKEGDPC